MRDSARESFGSSWHLIFQDNNLSFLSARRWALFVASPFSSKLNFSNVRTHTRSYAVWDEIGFYLMLVIDCEKLISKEGCADIAPRKNANENTGQTVLSSIKNLFHQHVREWWFTKYNKLCFMLFTPSTKKISNISIKRQFLPRTFQFRQKFHRHLNDKLIDIKGSSHLSPQPKWTKRYERTLPNVCCVHLGINPTTFYTFQDVIE